MVGDPRESTLVEGRVREVDAESVLADTLEAGEASVTNETVIELIRDTGSNTIPADTYVNLYDGDSKDNRDEFNNNAQFVPDKTGYYFIQIEGDIRGSTSQGDELSLRVFNVTDSDPPVAPHKATAEDSNVVPDNTFIVELTAGKAYEIQITDSKSSFKINGGGPNITTIRKGMSQL